MRSRVKKNQALYTQIASDTESKVESSDLSHFANRLNAIDEQFGKMDVASETTEPNHARNLQERFVQEKKADESPFSSAIELEKTKEIETVEEEHHDEFDTFESTYLSDFLQEVKDYNVKQGYRDMDNTSTNIMKDLNLDIEINKSRKISDVQPSSPFIPEGIDDLLTEIDPLIDTMETPVYDMQSYESKAASEEIEATRYFTAVDHMQRFDQDEAHLEQTIAIAVQQMVDEDEGKGIEVGYVPEKETPSLRPANPLPDFNIDDLEAALSEASDIRIEPEYETIEELDVAVEPSQELETVEELEIEGLEPLETFESEVAVEEMVVEPLKHTSSSLNAYNLTPFGLEAKPSTQTVTETVADHEVIGFGDFAKSDEVVSDVVEPLISGQLGSDEPAFQTLSEAKAHLAKAHTEAAVEKAQEASQESEVTRRLVEQTQTMQIKIIDQEKNIEEMSDTMVRTNRLLNVTLSLLMIAIFVVFMLILATMWRN